MVAVKWLRLLQEKDNSRKVFFLLSASRKKSLIEGSYNYTSGCSATVLGGWREGETIKFLDWAIAHQPGRKQPASPASL